MAIHNYNYVLSGIKNGTSSYKLNFKIEDPYDFTQFMIGAEWSKTPVGWTANDMAFISQLSGAIVPFKNNIEFNFTYSDANGIVKFTLED